MQALKFKRGDQFTLGATLDIGEAAQLTGCTVIMRLRSQDGSTVNEYTPTILSATAGTVQYKFLAGETDNAGVYWIEFWVTMGDGTLRKVPSEDWCNLILLDDIS